MKRIASIICLSLILVMSMACLSFAGSFKIVESTPKDGDKGMSQDNMGVKLEFNQDIYNGGKEAINDDCFAIVDENGKKVPLMIIYNKEEPNKMLVLADSTKKFKVKQDMKYTLTIAANLQSADGTVLGQEQKISFTTVNQKRTQGVNMGLMGVMMVGIIIFTINAGKKEAEKAAKEKAKKVNPYKVAKKTGKSVSEVVEKDKKAKAKAEQVEARERAKIEKEMEELAALELKEQRANNKRVSKPRPVSAAGSAFKTGRKAKAEAKVAAEAKKNTSKKPQSKSKKK